MDKIRSQIFMGSGDYSLAQIGHIHLILNEAFVLMGGIQQHPMSTEPEEAHKQHEIDIIDGQQRLEEISKEICMALTGKKVKFDA